MKVITMLVLGLVLLACTACSPAQQAAGPQSTQTRTVEPDHSRPDLGTGSDIARSYGFDLAGTFSSTRTVLPAQLTGEGWDLIHTANLMAGYDLKPYAGEAVTIASYPLIQQRGGSTSQTLVIVERDSRVVAAYVTVKGSAPGVLSLKDVAQGG